MMDDARQQSLFQEPKRQEVSLARDHEAKDSLVTCAAGCSANLPLTYKVFGRDTTSTFWFSGQKSDCAFIYDSCQS